MKREQSNKENKYQSICYTTKNMYFSRKSDWICYGHANNNANIFNPSQQTFLTGPYVFSYMSYYIVVISSHTNVLHTIHVHLSSPASCHDTLVILQRENWKIIMKNCIQNTHRCTCSKDCFSYSRTFHTVMFFLTKKRVKKRNFFLLLKMPLFRVYIFIHTQHQSKLH